MRNCSGWRRIVLGIAVGIVAGWTSAHAQQGPTQRPGAAKSGGQLVMVEHQITDPGMNNIVAATVLVPEGWSVEGGMTRPAPQFYSNPVLVDLAIEAPDGRGAHFFPSMSFEFNGMQQLPAFSPTQGGNFWHPVPDSVGQWILSLAQSNPKPGVTELQLVSEENVPELTAKLRQQAAPLIQQIQQTNQMSAGFGSRQDFDTQATKVVFRYKEDGKAMEETFLVTWQAMVMSINGQAQSAYWSVPMMRSMKGPVGTDYLNDPALTAIFASVRNNPQWDAEMARYWQELARIRHNGAMQRQRDAAAAHQKRMQTLNETSDIIANGWRDRSAAMDRMQEKTVDAIHEQTPYTTPSGETVKLPSFYDHVYTDGNGRYLLENDALYDPNTDPAMNSQTWQRIEPTW